MGKSDERNIAAEKEFSKLEQVLNQTADDVTNCLKVLKGNLSEYDSRHGNYFTNTAKSFMRSDMRTAKDTASDLKHVANQIRNNKELSESEITAARTQMNVTSDTLTVLRKTARAYDEKSGKSTGVKGMVDNVVGGKSDKDKDDKHGGLLGKSDKDTDDKQGGLFGKSDKDTDDKQGGLFGKSNKDKESEGGWFKDNKDDQGPLGTSDTVEGVVKSTLRDSFSGFTSLKHQLSAAENSLSPSFAERAKEAVLGVTDKLKGDSKSSPTHGDKRLSA